MTFIDLLPFLVSTIAVVVALWQGFLAKQQLDQAKNTQRDTEKLLDEIREKVIRIEDMSDETRRNVKEQITKLVDRQDDYLKSFINAPKENSQNEMIAALAPALFQNETIAGVLTDAIRAGIK